MERESKQDKQEVFGNKVTRVNKRREKTGELCEPCHEEHLFTYPSYSWCVHSLHSICLVAGHSGNTKKPSEGEASYANSLVDARGPRWLHSEPLTKDKMSFNSGLFSSNTNHCVYRILLSFLFVGWASPPPQLAYTTVFLYESFKARWREAKCFPASSQG